MNKFLTLYKASPRIYQAGFAFILCILIHNFPALISFLPEDAQKVIQTTTSVVINGGVGFLVIFLTKQFNTSGTGAKSDPFTKPAEGGGTTKVVTALVACCLLAGLSGCETVSPDGTVTRWDAKGTTDAINAGFQTWQQYDRQSRIIGYDNLGNPVYRQ